MKVWIAIFLLLSIPGAGIKTISKINSYADRAAKAYKQEKYAEAITAYEYLLTDLNVEDDQIRLNLAHAYYKAGLLNEARDQYRYLADHSSAFIRAQVHLQLGNIAAANKKYPQALALYRNALLAEPENDIARYNYELLKKYLALYPEKANEDKPEPQPEDDQLLPPAFDDSQTQPKQNPDANGDREGETETPHPDPAGEQPNQNGNGGQPQNRQKEQATGNDPGETEGQKFDDKQEAPQQNDRGSSENTASGDERARTEATQQQVIISPEKARMLLNAMRDAEMQYLQQLPKKPKSKPDKTKPDW
ncbi:tetratricopeptide repeat protein [Pontibacter burrus]|uniref:Aerotolerance protein n=1 Tax=Pontibacter burrus TaxID=2704466 RepID=A0A6B3LUD5_9BACT|nr:tetratricopeptide repeat protein [Pontibacter burrus]NEM97177.1 aerotolerance protein [Pontibacter burrus]